MRTRIFLLLLAIILILPGQVNASYWFKVIDITPVEMLPNSEANSTVSVKGLGSERAYVELVFRNVSEGLTVVCPRKIQNVFPQGVTDYECIITAGDLSPGNYSFVADVVALGAFRKDDWLCQYHRGSQATPASERNQSALKDAGAREKSKEHASEPTALPNQPVESKNIRLLL